MPLAATAGKTDPDDIPENYDATWRYKAGVSSKDGAFGKSANDDTSDWQDAYALFPGSITYVWMSGLGLPVAASGLDACGFIRRSFITWDKGHIVIGRGHYQLETRVVLVRRQEGRASERLARRRRDAMKYRLAGASYRAIAEKLTEDRAREYADANGISLQRALKKFPHVSVRTVWDDVTAEFEELRRETEIDRVNAMALQNARLDQLFSKSLSLFSKGDVPAGRLAVAVMVRRAKLNGLDAPTKIAPTDPTGEHPADTGAIDVSTLSEDTLRRVLRDEKRVHDDDI